MYRTILLILAVFAPIAGCSQSVDSNASKAVLVTGASTGIGRKVTERLSADGYFVYAGARKDSDLEALKAIKNVQPIRLDVTKPAEIDAALKAIQDAGRGLYGVVNNAGVVAVGSVVDTKWEEFELVMDVNIRGPYRITRAFAPLVIAQKGRIVNIGSTSGILAGADVSAYTMSKHALEAFTDALAQEMVRFGVAASIVEPGNYASEIWKTEGTRTGTKVPKWVGNFKQPDEVAAAVEQALFEPHPKRRYLVVPDQKEADAVIRKQIEQLVQLNEGQPYTYDREALIKMLDSALAKSRSRTQ